MKKMMFILLAAAFLSPISTFAADGVTKLSPAFWGKIVSVDAAQKTLTVHNRKRVEDRVFIWDATTKITDRKVAIKPEQLEEGQFLKVAFIDKDGKYIAQEIAVRPEPFKKAAAKITDVK